MQNYKSKFKILRKKYPKFIYQNYSYRISKGNLEILFDFRIEPNIYFKPKIIIQNINLSRFNLNKFDNLIFHLGLMEVPSYWKATCSPEIEIKAGCLSKDQINWWKDLIFKGMGQFFYENKIDFRKPNFLKIRTKQKLNNYAMAELISFNGENKILVPIGGGKDSAVTLELIKKIKRNIQCFSLNPTDAAQKIMKIAGCKKSIIVRRKIDEKLLELNRKGFLNGHTPFSAYLAFLSVLVAAIFGDKYIAFSNERSSNEGNVKYLGKIINHQWSKSFEFEEKFREYSKKYLAKDIEYFSFLRPLYEIQITKLFSKYPKYFPVFLSCNVAYQTASGTKKPIKKWCGNCPKCLFIFATLYPFVEEKKLIKIFGRNLFEDRKLLPIMQELIGEKKFKPFECVGTKKESLIAFYLSWKKLKNLNFYPGGEKVKSPFLLEYFEKKILPKYSNIEKESKKLLDSWNSQNNLPKEFEKIIKKFCEKIA
jgi:7-cyano-7-deazaguanine synthase in queuosine biosynthesis